MVQRFETKSFLHISKDWANPVTRGSIEEYPIRTSCVGEAYHAKKRTKLIPPELAAPMWADGGKHYFVGKIAQLTDGQLVVLRSWYRHESQGEVYADAWEVVHYSAVCLRLHHCDRYSSVLFCTSGIDKLFFAGRVPAEVLHGAHPLRDIAQGRRMYTSFIKLWGDDVSGNRSKQYNAHTNVYFTHANLPHHLLSQQYHIKFASTSQYASSGEQFDAVIDDTSGDNTWHTAYDCAAQEEIMLRIVPEVLPADNPQQSASCSHVGLHGNYPCRRCQFGGTELERETDQGYEQHFTPGTPRTATETLNAINEQLRAAALGVASTVTKLQTRSGVKDSLAEHWIQKLLVLAREKQQTQIKNPSTRDPRLNGRRIINPLHPGIHYSALLDVPSLDVHRDTPVELLHTYLLGVEKYTWYHIHQAWSDVQKETFATRLQSSSLDGLSLPALRASWMLQHPNNLIGKHLKALQQLTIFHLDESLCDHLAFDLCKATGELGALLWFHEIEDETEYKDDLNILIGNVLDVWSVIDPQRIFVKLKLHILLHILEDIENHGPGIHNGTENFKSNNGVFRNSSVLSNHLAPSRDIAKSLAVMESHKHVVSGGWWTLDDGSHVRAGSKVRQYFQDPHIQNQLGLTRTEDTPGRAPSIHLKPSETLTWICTQVPLPTPSSTWFGCKHVVSHHGDRCYIGSWVFISYKVSPPHTRSTTAVGRITHILTPADASATGDRVVLRQYTIPNSRHPHFGMPELRREPDAQASILVAATDVLFIVNVQHNCRDSGCMASGRRIVRQERQESQITAPKIEHKDDAMYILNTHALHHAALLRKALPRSLTKPIPYLTDRAAEHARVTAALHATHDTRRRKDAAAREARKAKASAAGKGTTERGTVEKGVGEKGTTENGAQGLVENGTDGEGKEI
ncbi:hypothetical protein C8Q79DRAFT_918071 [Trametes meyenii]|nr:hypothetical protein C8Q79DRAFT_918071 [Trametes meyenii]